MMDKETVKLVELYLRKSFGNAQIALEPRRSKDSAEVFLQNDLMGVVYEDNEDEDEDGPSYIFTMPILSSDLVEFQKKMQHFSLAASSMMHESDAFDDEDEDDFEEEDEEDDEEDEDDIESMEDDEDIEDIEEDDLEDYDSLDDEDALEEEDEGLDEEDPDLDEDMDEDEDEEDFRESKAEKARAPKRVRSL